MTMMRRRAEGGLRGREEAGGAHRYKMRERLVSIGDDYWIEDHAGNKAFKVDGKALRVRNTLVIQSQEGQDLYRIQERMLRIKDTMEIEKGDGGTAATIKKALITPLRDRWTVSIPGEGDWEVQGNILDHEYHIEAGRRERVAEVSKKWFRVRDIYGVEVEPGHDDALVLAVTAAIDQMAH
ncbi:LURP-one-related [anaerobic digester metagenome]